MSRPLHIVSHSHWDREWHQTFQQFRLRLVQLVDLVLDTLATDEAFKYFMLDGQTIILDDYTEIRPERRQELQTRIREGRLLTGPWYVHPDEFLVSGEALVRNILQGMRDCQTWGACMRVGYVPDQFGHIAQLPAIWRGFGIDSCVLWRGVDREESGIACTWHGLDGSTVLLVTLPDGYNHGEHLPPGGQALAERLRALAASLESLAGPEQPLLIMNGGDHALINRRLPAALPAAQAALGSAYTIIPSTLPAYIEALRHAGTPVRALSGELRSSRSAFLLPGVTSARIWIKQRNAALQTVLERQAEPLSALAAALGASYPGAELRQSWRYLLQNQPHDSICGCSIDQVHREMVTRYDWSEQMATTLRDQALAHVAAQVNSAVEGAEDPHTLAITIFNGADEAQTGTINLMVRLAGEATSYELIDSDGTPVPHTWFGAHGEPPSVFELPIEEAPDQETVLAQVDGNRIMGMGVQDVSMRTLGQTLHIDVTIGDQAVLSRDDMIQTMRDAYMLIEEAHCRRVAATINRSAELHLTALVPSVPARGYRTLFLRPRRKEAAACPPAPPASPDAIAIENERYRIEVAPDSGAVTIIDRAGGVRVGPANVFLDDAEAGDLYTHGAPAFDTVVGSGASVQVMRDSGPLGQVLHIKHELQVPLALAESRMERAAELVPLRIATAVTLLPGDTLVRFHTTVDNQARDHRLRVHTTLPFTTDHVHVADAFAMLRRAAQPNDDGTWAEQPVGTAPHQGVVVVHGDGACCLLATRGLPEYEVLPCHDGVTQVALTLLRCTGWLSRGDIPGRPENAGPPLATPEAQCAGEQHFEYALACGAEPWRALLPAARAFAVPLCASVGPCAEGWLPPAASILRIEPAAVAMSALKGAEDGRGAILRVFNQEPREHLATIRFLFTLARAHIVDLAEREIATLFDGPPRTELTVPVPAHGIVTVRLEWQAPLNAAPATS